MSDDEKKVWGAKIPAWKADEASEKIPYGEKGKLFEDLADLIINEGWSERAPIIAEVERRKRRRQEHRAERDRQERLAEEEEEVISTLMNRAAEIPDPEELYEEEIESLELDLRSGMHVTPHLVVVKELSENHDKSPEEIVEHLRERNPDVPDHAFERPPDIVTHDREGFWDGFSTDEEIHKPLEERTSTE